MSIAGRFSFMSGKSSVHAAIFASLCTEIAVENILFYFNPLNKRSSESLCTQAFQTTVFWIKLNPWVFGREIWQIKQ